MDFSVDTRMEKCSCKRWDLSGIPCSHGVSALRYDKIPPESRVNSCYSIETYCKAYEPIIMPCNDVTKWAKMNGRKIIPRPFQRKKGRRAKNRRQQPKEKHSKKGVKINKAGTVIHCGYCGAVGHNINGCLDWKLGLKPKKKTKRHRVRAEPDVSSSDEETVCQTQEINLQTAGVLSHEQPLYVAQIVQSLTQERESRQREEVVQGPLPENAFLQQQALSQPPVQPSTTTKTGDVHRKREVIAIARLRAAPERREIADQAKFDAAITKLK
ncbi:uncharacterized protein [Triticum aestivum]|uniref:uncharacterized protein n=1 Tax=Triticum aestivum TaxID=4565 RepID=UPI001D03301C|nr:uncharacterized protein LOC123151404 [Triticum aestivum]